MHPLAHVFTCPLNHPHLFTRLQRKQAAQERIAKRNAEREKEKARLAEEARQEEEKRLKEEKEAKRKAAIEEVSWERFVGTSFPKQPRACPLV